MGMDEGNECLFIEENLKLDNVCGRDLFQNVKSAKKVKLVSSLFQLSFV